jgi:hypothetical protein
VVSCPSGVRATRTRLNNRLCSLEQLTQPESTDQRTSTLLGQLVAVWYPEVPVFVGYTEVQGGFWNFLFGPDKQIVWQSAQGFVITPLDTHIVSAIVGLYFGAGFAK